MSDLRETTSGSLNSYSSDDTDFLKNWSGSCRKEGGKSLLNFAQCINQSRSLSPRCQSQSGSHPRRSLSGAD